MPNTAQQLAPSYTPIRSVDNKRYWCGQSSVPVRQMPHTSTRPKSRTPEILSKKHLHVVDGQRDVAKRLAWPYILLALVVAFVAIVMPLAMNTHMAQRSYDIRDRQIQLIELETKTSALEAQVLEVSSPGVLEKKACDLGLVPAETPGVISLDRDQVEGGTPAP